MTAFVRPSLSPSPCPSEPPCIVARETPLARLRGAALLIRLFTALGLLATAGVAAAADWPQWRYDAERSNASPAPLPAGLRPVWRIELGTPRPAWPDDQEKLAFDRAYEPVVVGRQLLVASIGADHLASYDTRTGRLRWRFFTEGPVRFAPTVVGESVYFVSDDGHLYCLDLEGRLRWKVRGGPSDARAIGNHRLISLWPARGAPVVADGVVYFAASIWPFMGTWVHAVDARSGRPIWTNSGTGSDYVVQQHSSPAFAGVAPQGYLAISGDRLVVPGGLTVPAVFDRATGELRFFEPGARAPGRDAGGFATATRGDWLFNRTEIYERMKGQLHGRARWDALTPDGRLVHVERDSLIVRKLPPSGTAPVAPGGLAAKILTSKVPQIPLIDVGVAKLPRRFDRLAALAADQAVLLADDGALALVELPQRDGPARVVWQAQTVGRPWRAVPADDRLFVSTLDGALEAFSAEDGPAVEPAPVRNAAPAAADGLVVLVPRGAEWMTTVDDAMAPDGWQQTEFDDSAWKSLPVALDEDAPKPAKTAVAEGESPPPPPPELTGRYRRAFTIAQGMKFDDARLNVIAPDRTRVWLDGRPIARLDVRDGSPVAGNSANPRGPKWASHELEIDPAALTPGLHRLALEAPRLVAAQTGEAFLLELVGERPLESPADRPPPVKPAGLPEFVDRAWPELAAAGSQSWCVVQADDEGELIEKLAAATDWRLVALEPDADRADRLRRRWADAGLLGARVGLIARDLSEASLPPYFASALIDASARPLDDSRRRILVESLRPYGGVGCSRSGGTVRRDGPLEGAGDWTHQNADAANSLMSTDRRVRLPLGILWFGGPSNAKILPRHGHGPVPQVVDGRLIIEGPDLLRAVDIYTGRLIWERKLKDLGIYYNNTAHHAGAGAIGGNYVSLSDAIYVAYGRRLLKLDPATGRTTAEFTAPDDGAERLTPDPKLLAEKAAGRPADEKEGEKSPGQDDSAEAPKSAPAKRSPYWGHLAAIDDLLIVTSTPTPPLTSSRYRADAVELEARFGEASRRLLVLDRRTGDVRWRRDARREFRHNAIVAGRAGDDLRLFCLDAMTELRQNLLEKRGVKLDGPDRLHALDARTGRPLWETEVDTPFTWLGYSAEHDVLLAAGSRFRDRAADEAGKGLAAYRGATGERLWKSDVTYAGPCLLLGDRIITQGEAFELLTGKPVRRAHPLTGEPTPWEWHRNYGCNTAVGCPNLLTFRSAAAGFFDLATDGGTGNFGGFRSSCTNNLIPAGGLLNAPDYTRTCTCSYQNQTSLAMVHRPDVEVWTFNPLKWSGAPVERLGVNFGAPGDRRAADGTTWLEFPSVGGRSPDVPIKVRAATETAGGETANGGVRFYRRHASTVADPELGWITASGIEGEARIEITTTQDEDARPRRYRLRLYFAEPDERRAGQRSFDVDVQGERRFEALDLVEAAGGSRKTVVREATGVEVRDKLTIVLRASPGSAPPVLSGVELIREDR